MSAADGVPPDAVKIELQGMAFSPDDASEVARLRVLVEALEKRDNVRTVACFITLGDDGKISAVVTCPRSKFSEQRIAAWLIEGMEAALNRLMAAAVEAAKEMPHDHE